MKFQDSSFNGFKVTVGTKSVTHARRHTRTHAPKAICPINFFKVGGIISVKTLASRQRFYTRNMKHFFYQLTLNTGVTGSWKFVCLICCFTSMVNSYCLVRTDSYRNYTVPGQASNRQFITRT